MKYTKKYNQKTKPKTHKKRPNRKSRKHAKKRGGFILFDSSKQTINTKQEAFYIFKSMYPPEYFKDGQLQLQGNMEMSLKFNKLYDVIKDATKPCDKDKSFVNPQNCRIKKGKYYTELIRYLYTLKVPLQKALESNYIFKSEQDYKHLSGDEQDYKHLSGDEQNALQKMEKQVNKLIEQTEKNLAERS